MQRFHHGRQQQLEGYLARLVDLDRAYASKEYGVDEKCGRLLDELLEFFSDTASAADHATVGHLIAYLATARDGTDPETLTPVRTGRRAVVRRAVYHLLSRLTVSLTSALEGSRTMLEESRQLLAQALLSGLQVGVVTEPQLAAAAAGDEGVNHLRDTLLADDRFRQVIRRARLNIHPLDEQLLIAELARTLS